MNSKIKVAVENTWNDRAAHSERVFSGQRPWYKYALHLLNACSIQGPAVDIGCGVGEFLSLLQSQGVTAVGCDGNEHQLDQVRAMGFRAELVDLEKTLPFVDSSFGLVSCLEVIEHIARAEHFLCEIHRILSTGGYLVLSTPNFSFWQYRFQYLLGRPPNAEGIHLRFFNSILLRRKLAEAGFQVVNSASYTPLTGVNWLRGRFSLDIMTAQVPSLLENPFASGLAVLAKKIDR